MQVNVSWEDSYCAPQGAELPDEQSRMSKLQFKLPDFVIDPSAQVSTYSNQACLKVQNNRLDKSALCAAGGTQKSCGRSGDCKSLQRLAQSHRLPPMPFTFAAQNWPLGSGIDSHEGEIPYYAHLTLDKREILLKGAILVPLERFPLNGRLWYHESTLKRGNLFGIETVLLIESRL